MLNKNFQKWLNTQKKENKIQVKVKKLKSLSNWNFNNQLIYHYSRKFFKMNLQNGNNKIINISARQCGCNGN